MIRIFSSDEEQAKATRGANNPQHRQAPRTQPSCTTMSGHPSDITRALHDAARGDRQAADRLLPLVYDELRQLAAARLARTPPGNTLQATALVHEAYLKLVGGQEGDPGWESRRHFFGAAANAMRNILVDQARRKARQRDGLGARADVEEASMAADGYAPGEMLALDDALSRLEKEDPRKAQIVTLRCFAGLTGEQIAELLGISDRTVDREWRFARSWLQRELSGEGAPGGDAP